MQVVKAMVIIRIKIAYILVSFIVIFTFLFCCYLFLIVPLCNYTLPSTFSPSPTRFASSTAHVNITSTPSVNTPITTIKVGILSEHLYHACSNLSLFQQWPQVYRL